MRDNRKTTRSVTQASGQLARSVQLAKEGDPAAWTYIKSEVRDLIGTRMWLPRHIDPDELATDTVSELWQALRKLRDDAKFLSFALTVARRRAGRMKREQGRHLPLTTDPEVHRADLNVGSTNLEGEEFLHSMCASLKSSDKQLFRLLYVVGATSSEVQSSLGISGDRLRRRKHSLHQKLRQATKR
jgi:RNA polymerase sigma factor (sigma-70 family)